MKNSSETKVSLIFTVFNEQATIQLLLDSIETQTLKPYEIVVVDACSTDKTVPIIENHAKKSKLIFRVFKKDLNRSRARNFAIKKAHHQIIAVSDAGNILGSHWLERITQPIRNDEAESVAGFYLPQTATPLQQAMAPFVAVMPQNFDPETYLPSSRSVAFTKTAWEKAGKYPKDLNYCEDLVFAMHLKNNSHMVIRSDAIVYWLLKKNLIQFFYQISNYAQGDIEANYQPHIRKIASQYLRYLIFLALPPLFFLYLLWPIYKHANHLTDKRGIIHLVILQITSDLAILYGASKGFLKKFGYI